MEVAADRRRIPGLGEGLNWGEGSKRQVNVLFNLWKCLAVYFYTHLCFIKHIHCNCKFIDKYAWLRELGELAAEVSTGGRKDVNFYLENANWMWYWEEKLLYKGFFFWCLPGRVKSKNEKEEERERCSVEVWGKRFGQWTNIDAHTHKSEWDLLKLSSFSKTSYWREWQMGEVLSTGEGWESLHAEQETVSLLHPSTRQQLSRECERSWIFWGCGL